MSLVIYPLAQNIGKGNSVNVGKSFPMTPSLRARWCSPTDFFPFAMKSTWVKSTSSTGRPRKRGMEPI